MPRIFALLLFATLAVTLPTAASAHIRYSCSSSESGTCHHFWGFSTSSAVLAPADSLRVDPINLVWYPYGTSTRAATIMNNEWDWTHTCGSDQYLYRTHGVPDVYWDSSNFQSQRASNGCPGISACSYTTGCDRYHARVWAGHGHQTWYDEWSVSAVHHENELHNIDEPWEAIEDDALANAARTGRGREDMWTYLPRADQPFQGYDSDGYAIRVAAN